MKVKVITEHGEEVFELRSSFRDEVIAFLNTLEANEKLLKEIKRLKIMINDLVNKK